MVADRIVLNETLAYFLKKALNMYYRHPTENIVFEIPDAWFHADRLSNFVHKESAFIATSNPDWPTVLLPVRDIQAPRRNVGVVGLHEDRTKSLLHAFLEGTPVPPLEVNKLHGQIAGQFSIRDGYHRYFVSIALGFTMLPVSIRPYFDINAL